MGVVSDVRLSAKSLGAQLSINLYVHVIERSRSRGLSVQNISSSGHNEVTLLIFSLSKLRLIRDNLHDGIRVVLDNSINFDTFSIFF